MVEDFTDLDLVEKEYSNIELNRVLNPIVKKWFNNKFPSFAPAQKLGVMPIHCRENILISSQTGSGKTLTGFLAILNELIDSSIKGKLEDKVYAIYISPLKALGYDIEHNLLDPLKEIEAIYGKSFGIRIGVRTGDTSQYERQKMVKNPPHILITTPESIALMLVSPKMKENLKSVDWVIVDEIHALAENKRGVHLSLLLEQLQYYNPGLCRVGLSATVAPLEAVAKYLVGTNRPCKIAKTKSNKNLDIELISPVKDLVNSDYDLIQKNLFKNLHYLIQSHKTTLIFTNTRAATEKIVHGLKDKFAGSYYDSAEKPPFEHASLIGAHHGSLSKEVRHDIEDKLRQGLLKCAVCSTSLELGIDIGSIDLVILLGSPKSVARSLQRMGRSGHSLDKVTKAKIIVTDRDDLIECSVLLKNALENKIDRIHIPQNSYDLLVQHILGFVLNETIDIKELFELTKESFCYRNLSFENFNKVVKYLAGDYKNLENRYIFSKIWVNGDGTLSRKGRLTRMIYTSNLGSIPTTSGVVVKVGDYPIGSIDESFLEKLKRGDRFVLGGEVYEFKFARGMTAQVTSAFGKSPTIPSWVSEMLPLSFDLAKSVQNFRSFVYYLLKNQKSYDSIVKEIMTYAYVGENTAEAILNYIYEEFLFTRKVVETFPKNDNFVIEEYVEDISSQEGAFANKKYFYIFHSLFGRKVNQALSRVIAFIISKKKNLDIEVGINDNGFYLASIKNLDIRKAFSEIEAGSFREILKISLDNSEILKRRFRHCAERSLMILRSYKGRIKQAGRQQVSSMILLKTAKAIEDNFIILEETYREIMEDVMDIENAESVFSNIKKGALKLVYTKSDVPSPFANNLVLQGFSDIVSVVDKHKFLQEFHKMSLIKISMNKQIDSKQRKYVLERIKETNYETNDDFFDDLTEEQKILLDQLESVDIDDFVKENLSLCILGDSYSDEIFLNLNVDIVSSWPKNISNFTINLIQEKNKTINYEKLWEAAKDKELEEKDSELFRLKQDLALAFKKRKTPYDVIEDVFLKLDTKKPLKQISIDYFNNEFSNKIHKAWSDKSYSYLVEKIKV